MIDVNTCKPSRTQLEYYANQCAQHRPSEIKLSDVVDTYPMLSHSNINCLYFIISVK